MTTTTITMEMTTTRTHEIHGCQGFFAKSLSEFNLRLFSFSFFLLLFKILFKIKNYFCMCDHSRSQIAFHESTWHETTRLKDPISTINIFVCMITNTFLKYQSNRCFLFTLKLINEESASSHTFYLLNYGIQPENFQIGDRKINNKRK